MDEGPKVEREPPWYAKPFILVGCALLVLTSPLWLPIFFLVVFLISKVQDADERRFIRRMKDRGRFKGWEELRPVLEAGEGTLIIEQGHKLPARVWWTAEDVLLSAPCPPPHEDELQRIFFDLRKSHAFVSWCQGRYLDEDDGIGLLTFPTGLPDGLIFAPHFREQFPGLTTIDTAYDLARREAGD